VHTELLSEVAGAVSVPGQFSGTLIAC
jgi:hypothetical protein